MRSDMKNKFLSVLLIILMLVPTVVAIINYSMMQGGEAASYNTVSVTLEDFKGNVYTFERESENSKMLDYFIKAIANAEETSKLPTSIEAGNYYIVTMNTTLDKFGYQFYYTTNAQDCYCYNGNLSKTYKLAQKDATEFLQSPYAACLFENGTAPALTLSGTSVSPDSATWKFKNTSDEYVAFDTAAIVNDELETVSLEGGIAMEFDLEPDSLTVTIVDKDTKEILHDGDYSKLFLDITKKTNVTVEACAKWYEDTNRTYYGEEVFKFDAVLGAPASFTAGIQKIEIGEFIAVTGENVSDPSKITFQSEPEINYTPTFYKDEATGKAIALIPFNWNLSAGTYSLTFAYGGTTQVIDITLTQRSNPFKDNKTVEIPKSVITNAGSEANQQKATETLREIAKQAGEKRYFGNGDTLYYDNSMLTISLGYGHTATALNTEISFRNTGIDFYADKGDDVMANLGGEIIYADFLDYSGYTVCIDHGYGLKTWYAHLNGVSVKKGDVVAKGDVIGVAGDTGFTDTVGFHVGMTIFDTPICTYSIWENGTNSNGEKGIILFEEE